MNIEYIYIYSYTTKANGKIIETKSFLCYKLNFKIQILHIKIKKNIKKK